MRFFRTLPALLFSLFLLLTSVLTLITSVEGAPDIREGNIIRDSEIEAILLEIVEPIFNVAGLDPDHLNLYIVASSEINAAASLDYSIFINTALITKAKTLDEVVGVLAHETGHLALGHVARFEDSIKRSSIIAMASMALGIVAGIAGSSDAAIGTIMAGQQIAMGSLMHYSQGQEASADQAAVRFLDKLGWTAKGLSSFMNYLAKQELRSAERQDAYMRTHPLSSVRVEMLNSAISQLKKQGRPLPSHLYDRFDRMVMKIKAFMTPPMTMLMQHPPSKTGYLDRYARAISYYRQGSLAASLKELKALLSVNAQDAYLHELKGQILFENGKVDASYKAYQKAVALAPYSPLIRLSMVQAMMERQNADLQKAFKELHIVLQKESKNPMAWHLLAVIYGKQGKTGLSALALAEKALTLSDLDQALAQAKRALHLTTDRTALIRAKDIVEMVLVEKKNS